MAPVATITELEAQLSHAREAAACFLEQCAVEAEELNICQFPADLVARARELSAGFHPSLVRISSLVSQSPMFGKTDLDAIKLSVRRIDAALRLRQYEEWGPETICDEDIVLGVRPAGSSEDRRLMPRTAIAEIDDALDQVLRRLKVLRAQAEAEAAGESSPSRVHPAAQSLGIRPGTAFIMMMIDPGKPELEDVKRAIQEECARFRIHATRADEIEHSGEITQLILDEIRTSEFLVADLTCPLPDSETRAARSLNQ